jgi:hypothetical protein
MKDEVKSHNLSLHPSSFLLTLATAASYNPATLRAAGHPPKKSYRPLI